MKSVAWTVWFVLILSILFLAGAKAQDLPPDLTGTWVLNEKDSDDFAWVVQRASGGGQEGRDPGVGKGRSGGGRGGGGRGGGGRGGGGGIGDGDSSGDEVRQIRQQQKLARILEEYSHLEIYHDGIELNVTNGLDISRLLFTDGRQMNIWTQQGEASATAFWQDRTLVVSWKTSQDTMNRIRYFNLAEGGQQLTLTENRRLPGQDKTIEIKLVYDLVD